MKRPTKLKTISKSKWFTRNLNRMIVETKRKLDATCPCENKKHGFPYLLAFGVPVRELNNEQLRKHHYILLLRSAIDDAKRAEKRKPK